MTAIVLASDDIISTDIF